jgi:hypothetical protein
MPTTVSLPVVLTILLAINLRTNPRGIHTSIDAGHPKDQGQTSIQVKSSHDPTVDKGSV